MAYLDESIPKNEYLEIIEALDSHHLNTGITLCIPALSEIPEHVHVDDGRTISGTKRQLLALIRTRGTQYQQKH